MTYTVSVASSVASVTVTPTAINAVATITVNTNTVASGSPSEAISLTPGVPLDIVIEVTAADGTTTQIYTVTVTREAPPIGGATTGTVTEDDPVDTASGQLNLENLDGGVVAPQTGTTNRANGLGTYGIFVLDADGAWTYTLANMPANASPADATPQGIATNALTAGVTVTDVFTVQSATNNSVTQEITITITGANDPLYLVNTRGEITEDGEVSEISMILSLADPDGFPPSTPFSVLRAGNGIYGQFTINGRQWSYSLGNDRAVTNALTAGQVVTDSLTVSARPTVPPFRFLAAGMIIVTITGADDPPTITGGRAGAVTEDAAEDTATGALTVTDPDSPVTNTFQPQSDVVGIYGAFTLTDGGAWIYTLNNDDPDTNALGVTTVVDAVTNAVTIIPDMVTETFQVQASDNTGAVVTITITGANDAPTAEAGDAQVVTVSTEVTLDGTGSRDPEDGSPQTYRWVQIDSREVLPNAVATARLTFTASSFTEDTVLTFELTVTDRNEATDTDTVTVTVHPVTGGISGIELTSDAGEDGVYATGDEIVATVMFSAAVTVDTAAGSPQLALTVGLQTRQAVYDAARSTPTALVFSYTVAAGDQDGDGVSIGENALILAGGTINENVSGQPTRITHSEVAAARQHRVDLAGAPTVVGVTISTRSVRRG